MNYHVIGGFLSPVHIDYGKRSLVENFHRVNMVGESLQSSDWISVDPWECAQDGWSTTASVIDRYQNEFDELHRQGKLKMPARACLLGGADLIESFVEFKDGKPVWDPRDVDKIVSRGLLVVNRDGFDLEAV